ncbi:MAG: methyl-accepting chemotaxis protein [Proteobacteria bacterium]|nr:methyl-accepting chemotaxis protein [Pseudomonadota bacterium]
MKNLSFRATTMLGFCILIAMFSIIVGICVFGLHQIQKGMAEIENEIIPYERQANEMAFDVVQIQQFLTDASATHARDGFDDAEKFAKAFKNGLKRLKGHYAAKPEKIRELDLLETSFDTYYATGKRMAEVYIAKGMDAGNEVMKQPQTGFDAVAEDITVKMSKLRDTEIAAASSKVHEVDVISERATYLSLGAGLLAILLGLGIAWRITTGLLNMLGVEPMRAKEIVRQIAEGDLSRDIQVNGGDDSSLLSAVHSMQVRLREMIGEVTRNANSIVELTQHLAEASRTVHSGSQRQNDAAAGVASAVEEMTANIGQIAGNADDSETIAKQAGGISDQGSLVVADAVDEMNQIAAAVKQSSGIIRELGESSQKISEIVKVIKDIADQTNLLALNAAIEAARAGEQGRGFAVVADEVRKLAASTASATQEISIMVEDIQKSASNAVSSMEQGTERVNQGVAKAERAGSSMAQIKQGTEQVLETVVRITGALKEQSVAVNMIAQEAGTIASMALDNTHAVDDLAKTSEQLNQLASALHGSISHFKA